MSSPIWAWFEQHCLEEQQKLVNYSVEGESTNKRLKYLDTANGVGVARRVPEAYRADLNARCLEIYGKSLVEIEQAAEELTGSSVQAAAAENMEDDN